MIAEIKSVNLQATKTSKAGKQMTGYEIVYQAQASAKYGQKPPTTRFLFKDSPIAEAVENISPGDWVEIRFDDSQWKNPEAMVKVSNPNSNGATPTQAPSQNKATDWDAKDKKIARAVAFKGATEIVSALIAVDGAFPKTSLKKPEFFVQQVIDMANQFEPYVNMEEDVETSSEISSDDATLDQEEFAE